MCAKPGKKGIRKSSTTGSGSLPAAAGAAASTPATEGDGAAWIDSPDPRRRRIGQVVLIVVWIYVAALWLLALDQTFGWGVF